jgi:hypothetical protein
MIPEVAILDVIPDKRAEFEASIKKAQEVISSMNGWLGLNYTASANLNMDNIEKPANFILSNSY